LKKLGSSLLLVVAILLVSSPGGALAYDVDLLGQTFAEAIHQKIMDGVMLPKTIATIRQPDQPGIIMEGRALAPLRFVAEAFGGSVSWDDKTRTAAISRHHRRLRQS
jgi:hypothetical protein